MISLSDLVTLAKAGWTPHATKEVLELFQTVPEAKDAEVKPKEDGTAEIAKTTPITEKKEEEIDFPNTPKQEEDDLAKLVSLLKEEK